jgi:hypothetical protein
VDSTDHPDRPLYRYRFDDAEFDEARATLRVAGERVDLEQRPLQVLALLLQRVDEVVPRAELFDTVWEGRPTVDNVLANAVAKLRKALGAAAARIVNVPRVGESLASFECKLTQLIQLEGADGKKANSWLVLGEVVAVYIDKSLIKDGVYQTALAHPILRAGRLGDYAEIRPDAMFEMVRPA